MKLPPSDLAHLAKIALDTAKEASRLISSHQHGSSVANDTDPKSRLGVRCKEGADSLAGQVLTEADLASQALIQQRLEQSRVDFDLGFLGEESADDGARLQKDYFWCVDPIDGTLPFIEGTDGFSVSIALVSRAGEPTIGVAVDPATGVGYHAIRGQGAWRDGQPWRPVADSAAGDLTVTADRSLLDDPQYLAVLETLRQRQPNLRLIAHGGAVMNALWALEQAPGVYFKRPKPRGGSLWDYAATACIYHEVGAVATDLFGHPLDLNRADSTYLNHRGILFASHHALAESVKTAVDVCDPNKTVETKIDEIQDCRTV